jgi:hypothetical protein
MNNTKKLLCTLISGATLIAAAPVFADSYHDSGYDHHRYEGHYRDYGRHEYRGYDHRPVVVVQRPYVVERPVYYSQPAPVQNYGIGAIVGAAIGSIYDSRH